MASRISALASTPEEGSSATAEAVRKMQNKLTIARITTFQVPCRVGFRHGITWYRLRLLDTFVL